MSAPTPAERREWSLKAVMDLSDENERLRDAILDIDAHATPMGEDDDGFVAGGYLISVGCLHRALGVIGGTAPRCSECEGHDAHDWRAERDALREQIERLRFPIGEGHYRGLDWDDPERAPFCGNCMEMWPCPAARAALTEDQP